ncbi:MAG: ParB/RepB/Spo0J family partition protein [Cryomorphaceae bacterium]|jgi:ParB family chromosome partitioning protein|nr:ParB/RepB/Spo0J family partition protein [Cryomorphaceae bacterium]MDG1889386.1 ParB/RepB/Spo0J family partition protein [Flavobacteriaceae bacterium]MBT3502923.1 ParB/RepB/Spo0J family partition protein [Cryomorphaceae bacterium]MBT3688698.1 ParB/RepB/Spo0J family partition protein [Cryomorphaceae bacterium]MBT4222584.1 ParB/RepB/Spo0J family partition protein [Cryomorphaceae bacterium]
MSNKKQKRVLGRGLDALLNSSDDNQSKNDFQKITNSLEIGLDKIQVNPNQPRTNFDTNEIENLSLSIKDLGIIQPITVRKNDTGNYEIISGERRFRASKKAGLSSIPCYIKGVDNETDVLKMSLVENIQRVDLDPIEIGLTYERLINDYNLNIDSISRLVGKNRSTISNYIRLLKLDPIIQSGIRDGFLSMGHGRALINIDDKKLQLDIYKQIISSKLSVRQTENIVRGKKISNVSNSSSDVSKIYIDATNKFENFFDSKVTLKENSEGKVSLSTTFKSINDLYSIIKKLSN